MSKKKNKKKQVGTAATLLAMSAMMCAAPAVTAFSSALPVFATEDGTVQTTQLSDVGVQVRCVGHFEDGSPKLSIKLEDGGKTLKENKDYKANTSTAGDGYSVHIIGEGRYDGDTTVNFSKDDIEKTPLYDSEETDKMLVTIAPVASVNYDGTEQKPSVDVTSGDKTLEEGKDYKVDYSNNKNAGTGTITVSGKKIKTATASFTINPKSLGAADVTMSVMPSSYKGEAPKADDLKVNLSFKDTRLTENADYAIEVENIDGGMTVKATGMNNFSGEKTFTVAKTDAAEEKDIATASMIGFQDSIEQDDDKAVTQDIILQKGDKVLEKDTDYTVSYAGNTKAGTATMVLQGIGDYTGSIRKDFQITEKDAPADIQGAKITVTPGVDEDGNPNPIAKVEYQGKTLTENTDYTVTYTTDGDAVQTTVTGINGYTGTATSEKPLSDYQELDQQAHGYKIADVPDVTYDGKAHTLTIDDISVVDKDGKPVALSKDAELQIESGDTTSAGTVKFTVTDKKLGSLKKSYNIVPADISKASVKISKASGDSDDGDAEGDADKQLTAKVSYDGQDLVEGTDYTVKYNLDDDDATDLTGKAVITGTGNYTGTLSKEFDVDLKASDSKSDSKAADSTKADGSDASTTNAEAAEAEAARSEYMINVVTKDSSTSYQVPASCTFGELVSGLPKESGWKNAVTFKLSANGSDSVLDASTKFSDLAPKIAGQGDTTVTAYDKDGKSLGSAVLSRTGEGTYQMKFDTDDDASDATAADSAAAAENTGKEDDGKEGDGKASAPAGNGDAVAEVQHTSDPGTIPLYGMGLMSAISSALTGVWAMLKKKRM